VVVVGIGFGLAPGWVGALFVAGDAAAVGLAFTGVTASIFAAPAGCMGRELFREHAGNT
jgi:hypothetical protein